MNTLKLEFPIDTAVENDGLGDAGIETFRDSAYASCARETGQNSRDAASGAALPVRVTFNVIHVPRSEIPDSSHLTSTLESCLQLAPDEKHKDFFNNALSIIRSDKVPILHIADYNTKGLTGPPNTRGTPFHSLLKSRGVTNKGDNDDPTGSFGIGKNAVVAVSELQTVFYSTLYKDKDGSAKFAGQGKAILVSHQGADGQDRRSTGYWGNVDGFSAVTEQTNVPFWMKRTEIGTSIYCIGFREGEGIWKDLMTCSIISNFFSAIEKREMEFEVGTRIINSNTLQSLLHCPELYLSAKGTNLEDALKFARALHRCLMSGATIEHELEIKNLGKVTVRILTEKGMPRRVGFIRNGMLITDNLSYFGHKLQRFPTAKDFICLVEPSDSTTGKILKTLENPKHEDFSADRIADHKKRDTAIKAMRQLGSKLRDLINENAGAQIEESIVIDELAKLFSTEEDTSSNEPHTGLDPERFTYRVIQKKNRNQHDKNGSKKPGSHTQKNNKGSGSNYTPGKKGADRTRQANPNDYSTIELSNIRNRISQSGNPIASSRVIYFEADKPATLEIEIFAIGINTPDQLKLTNTDYGSIKNGKLMIDVTGQKRYAVTIMFEEPYAGPIEIIARKRESKESQLENL